MVVLISVYLIGCALAYALSIYGKGPRKMAEQVSKESIFSEDGILKIMSSLSWFSVALWLYTIYVFWRDTRRERRAIKYASKLFKSLKEKVVETDPQFAQEMQDLIDTIDKMKKS